MTEITVAFLVAVGAADVSRPTLVLQAKEAVRPALDATAAGAACDGCTVQPDLLAWYEKTGGRFMVCPVCFHARKLAQADLLPNAELGAVQPWAWTGDDGATTLGYRRMNNWREVMFGSVRRRFWAESVSAAMAAVLALVTVAWPDWIEIVTGSAPDGGSGALERAVVAGLAAAAMLLAVGARAEWRRAAPAAR